MAVEYIYPGSSSFSEGQTPFGTFDTDAIFQADAPKIANWCAKRLGYPIQNVELVDESFYSCFEEATAEYAAQVNQFNIRNNLDVLKGVPTGTDYSQKLVEGSILPTLIGISDAYGTLAGVGGNTDIKSGSIDVVSGQQTYDLCCCREEKRRMSLFGPLLALLSFPCSFPCSFRLPVVFFLQFLLLLH